MKCYVHPQIEAVAVCKSCGRAVCHECVTEVGLSCACKGRCETDVSILNDLVVRGSSAYQKTSGVYTRSGVFILLLGLLFTGAGLLVFNSNDPNYFMLLMGPIFVVYGVVQFFNAKRYREK